MKRELASRGVKVDNTEQTRLWRAIEEHVKVWNLKEVLVLCMNEKREALTMERE